MCMKDRELSRPSQNLPHMLITFVPSHLLSIRQSNDDLNVYMLYRLISKEHSNPKAMLCRKRRQPFASGK